MSRLVAVLGIPLLIVAAACGSTPTAAPTGGISTTVATPPATTTPPAASTVPADTSAYKTDAQAQDFLEKQLTSWAGVKLSGATLKMALCLNGAVSKTEQHAGATHYASDVTNAAGENLFGSFGCSLTVDSRTFNLYLVPGASGWKVSADR